MPNSLSPRLVFPDEFAVRDGIFQPTGNHGAFDYSDGSAVEAEIHSIVCAATDRSSGSFELERGIHDWPTEYHLSRARANLLRPFDLARFHNVLEIGSGCGAITRYLGETCRCVTALEGSVNRASIVRDRCADLGTVTCVCANVNEVRFREKFDLIVVIGVWEYSGEYLRPADDPWRNFLDLILDALAPGGTCILAIENQMGLKYLAGAPEDHTGRAYEGLEGYYPGSQVRTFGRAELMDRFAAAGLTANIYLPFPDYKLPRVILRGDATRQGLGLSQWHDRNSPTSNFCEPLVFFEAEKNGLLADLANSFLIVANRRDDVAPPCSWDAAYYALGRRKCYQTETRLTTFEGRPTIVKSPLYPDQLQPSQPALTQLLDRVPFCHGQKLSLRMLRALRRGDGKGQAEFQHLVAAWHQYLFRQAKDSAGHRAILPANMVDATPFNLVESESGLELIDREWTILDRPVSVGWVLFRGLYWFLMSYWNSINDRTLTLGLWGAFIEEQFAHLGCSVSPTDIPSWVESEALFQQTILEGQSIDALKRQIEHALGPVNPVFRAGRRAAYRAGHLAGRVKRSLRNS